MIAAHGGDNVCFARAHPGKFNRPLDGLGTGITQEEALETRRGDGRELFEQAARRSL